MLWRVLKKAIPEVVVLYRVQWDGLESPPTKGDNQWIPTLEDLLVPSVLL